MDTDTKVVAEVLDEAERMTRRQAADYIGISIGLIQIWELQGRLHPVRQGKRVFLKVYEVDQIKADYKPKQRRTQRRAATGPQNRERGRIAARSFEMFSQGKTMQDVVIELRIDPRYATELWDLYVLSPDERRERERLEDADAQYRKEIKSRDWKDFQITMKKLDVKAKEAGGGK